MNSDISICIPVNHFLKKDDWLPWVGRKQSVGHLINSSIDSGSPKSQIWILTLQVTSHVEWACSFGHLIFVFLVGKVGNTCLVIFLGCHGMLMIQGKINYYNIKTIFGVFWTSFLPSFLSSYYYYLFFSRTIHPDYSFHSFYSSQFLPPPLFPRSNLSHCLHPSQKRAGFPGTSFEYGTTRHDNTYLDIFCDIWVVT